MWGEANGRGEAPLAPPLPQKKSAHGININSTSAFLTICRASLGSYCLVVYPSDNWFVPEVTMSYEVAQGTILQNDNCTVGNVRIFCENNGKTELY